MNLIRFYHLVRLSSHAQLKTEAHRSYLGYLWWIAEPLLNTFLFYTLFFLFLGSRTVDYLQFLLVGTILWQWIQTTLHLSATSILDKPHLLRQIKVPLALFPISKVIANTVKFFVIYSLLLVYLVVQGYIPTPHWLSIIPLLILHAALLISLAIPLALLTPFAPDLKTVLDAALRFLMLLSGIFFTSDKIPQHLILYFYSNPIVHILESHRLVLLYGSSPTYYHWLYPLIIIILLIPFNLLLLRFSDGRIPKILK